MTTTSDPPSCLTISVLLATRRRPSALAATLDGLAAMDQRGLSWQLIVVDNAGDAETQAVVSAAATRLPVTLLVESTPGKNRALNRALQAATGALIVFCDDDVRVEATWLRALHDGATRWPDATMFGGRILPAWPAGHDAPLPHPFHDHAYGVADFAHPEGRYSSGYVYGANMAIRASVFAEGWRFDERMGPDGSERYITGSETSLTVALERAGHRAVYLPGALVHHQIRPDQLTAAWLHGRAFRKGRAAALRKGLGGGPHRVPRELWTTTAREFALWWTSRLRGDRIGALDHALAYWTARGMIYHCWVTRPLPAHEHT